MKNYTERELEWPWEVEHVEALIMELSAVRDFADDSTAARLAAIIEQLQSNIAPALFDEAAQSCEREAEEEDESLCEGCQAPATHRDDEGVPLCEPCWASLVDSSEEELAKACELVADDAFERGWLTSVTQGALRNKAENLRESQRQRVLRAKVKPAPAPAEPKEESRG